MKLYPQILQSFSLWLAASVGVAVIGPMVSPQSAQAQYTGLGRESVDPAIIKRYAPPALPPEVVRPIEALMDVRAPGMGILSPDGKQLFFTWSITGTPQVWRIDGPKGFPRQMTSGRDATFIGEMTPDGKFIFFSRDRQGEENPGIYMQSTAGGPLETIYQRPKVRASLQYIASDSRTIYFSANDIRPDSFALYRYDLITKEKRLLLNQQGVWGVADVWDNAKNKSNPQRKLLLYKATGNRSSEYYELTETAAEVKNPILKPILGQGETEDYSVMYSAKPGEFLVLTAKFGEFERLYRYIPKLGANQLPVATMAQFTPITPEMAMDVSGFSIVGEPRQKILYRVNDRGYTRTYGIDGRTFAPIKLPDFAQFGPVDHIYPGSSTRDGRYTSFGIETATSPRTSYIYDWEKETLTQWVLPSTPEVNTQQFVGASLESYPAQDGTAIPMFVYRPPQCNKATLAKENGKPCPVIVHFHGGPEGQSGPGFSAMAQMFVQAGFIFVEPNVRGSSGYGKTWLDADNGPRRLQVITDIPDAAKYIRNNWQVNGTAPKIGVMGGSYGGYATLIAMTKFAGSYDAGVSSVGISNLVTFLNNTAPFRRILRITEYGDPVRDREALVALSPTTYIDRIKAPLLIIQGVNDPRVPVGEALQMRQALEKRGISSQLILFADEGHGPSNRSNRVLEIGHTINFFRQHLQ
ncbi:MAG: S9 family peptidase [Pseudanabaenaceae cyanobacterium]